MPTNTEDIGGSSKHSMNFYHNQLKLNVATHVDHHSPFIMKIMFSLQYNMSYNVYTHSSHCTEGASLARVGSAQKKCRQYKHNWQG